MNKNNLYQENFIIDKYSNKNYWRATEFPGSICQKLTDNRGECERDLNIRKREGKGTRRAGGTSPPIP